MKANTKALALKVMRQAEWLARHPSKLADRLVSEGRLTHLNTGEWAQSEGDDRGGLYIVIDGLLHTYYAPKGDRVMMLGFAKPGSVLGHATKYSGGPRLVTAVCAEPSSVLEISESALDRIGHDMPEVWRAIADLTYNNLQSALRLAVEFISLRPRERIAARLLSIIDSEKAQQTPTVKVSQELLAEMVGATRKTVNQHLSTFEKAGLIKIGYGQIQICDKAGLTAIVSG